MKTLLFAVAIAFTSTGLFAQNAKLDDIFNKFQDKEGITSVILTGDLMKFASQMNDKDSSMNFIKNITKVRILAMEKSSAQDIVAFEGMVKDIPLAGYKELMIVKENENNVRMLARESAGRWSDFLLIVVGKKDHALIDIQGSVSPKDLQGLSKTMHVNGMACVNKLK
jgi:hypothetical protein